jgi:hypothetical protein
MQCGEMGILIMGYLVFVYFSYSVALPWLWHYCFNDFRTTNLPPHSS